MLDLYSLNKSINNAERQRKKEQEEKEQVELSHNKSVQQIVNKLKKNGVPTQEQIENYIISNIRRIPDSCLQNLIEEYYSNEETDRNEPTFHIYLYNKIKTIKSIGLDRELDENHINSWKFNNTDKKPIIQFKKNTKVSPNYQKLNIRVMSKIMLDLNVSIGDYSKIIKRQLVKEEQEFKGSDYISYNNELTELDEKNIQTVKDSLEILYKDLLDKSFMTHYLKRVIADDKYDNWDWTDTEIYLNDNITEAFIQRIEDFGLVVTHTHYYDSQDEFWITCKNPLVR